MWVVITYEALGVQCTHLVITVQLCNADGDKAYFLLAVCELKLETCLMVPSLIVHAGPCRGGCVFVQYNYTPLDIMKHR